MRISLLWQFRSTYCPDDEFNMTNWGRIKWRMVCSTQESCNQSFWSAFYCRAIVDTILPPAMHWEFHSNGNSEAPTDQTINSTWPIGVELSGEWSVPHKKVVISHFEVLSIVGQSSNTILPPAMHREFHCNGNSEAPTDQTINSTWPIGVELSGEWSVPHKKVVISHFEVLSIVGQSSIQSYLQQCIENFIAMAIPKHLLTTRSIQHDQLGSN